MGGTVERLGRLLVYCYVAVTLAVIASFVATMPVDGFAGVALAVLFASLGVLLVVGLWRLRTGREGEHLGTVEDIAYDPIAYPGDAAKHRWRKVVRRLPGEDDEED